MVRAEPETDKPIHRLAHKAIRTVNAYGAVLTFNDALDPARAQDPSNYVMFDAGRGLRFGTRDDVKATVTRATYDPVAGTVSLTFGGQSLSTAAPARMTVRATDPSRGVMAARGRLLDGNADGGIGGDYVGRLEPLAIVMGQRTTDSRAGITGVVLSLNLPLDSARARIPDNDRLTTAGGEGLFGTADDGTLAVKKVVYSATARTITLAPLAPRSRKLPYRLTVNGTGAASGLTDTSGSLLDGDRNGVAGGDYVGWFWTTARSFSLAWRSSTPGAGR